MTDIEFMETFVGHCQHLGYRVVLRDDNRLYYECMMAVAYRGTLHRCRSARPLTSAEIIIEARNGRRG